MKRVYLIGIAAAAMLTGCSLDETVEVAQNDAAISFTNFVDYSTKATDITNDNLTDYDFKVWSLMSDGTNTVDPFNGKTVSNDAAGWTYTPVVYWENGNKYTFVAIASNNNTGWTYTAPTEFGKFGSISLTANTGEEDLIYDFDDTYLSTGVTVTETQCPAAISFTFGHMLSRVKFAFVNKMADGSVLNVTEVKITNANTTATVDLDKVYADADKTITWENASGAKELSFGAVILPEGSDGFTSAADQATKETAHKYMIPVDGQYTLTFKVTRKVSGLTYEYEHETTLPDVEWAAGNSFLFTAALAPETIDPDTQLCPIVFTASVDDWTDFANTNLPDYTLTDETTGLGE